LAYLAEVPVNWCPALGTVLANEEVKDGRYVETGDPVERRLMRQWMLKITEYAERLLDDLALVDWPESVKEMQRNWIGRSEGADVRFEIVDHDRSFTVFTTRPDTLFGATYCVLAPEHPLVGEIVTGEQRAAVEAYVAAAAAKSDLDRTDLAKEKTGEFTGAYAVNPANGAQLPIWVADYVLMTYGTGAIMAVPGQDQRDWEFAKTYDLPIIRTVEPPESFEGEAYLGDGPAISSEFLDGLWVSDAKERMIEWLEERGLGQRKVQYKLRDWLFSRQRYSGEVAPVPEAWLPVTLPEVDEFRPTEDGQPPLARADQSWLQVTLPDGRRGWRETNTMPQWAGSCWYYLRFVDPSNSSAPFSPQAEQYWMPVDLYVGGVEHAVLHLLYARFWHKVLYDCGLVHTVEPFTKLFNQGMILAYSYRDAQGRYFHPNEVEEDSDGTVRARETGEVLASQIEKMSKSKSNVVNPDDVIADYGADAMRLYELFMGPLEVQKPWQMKGVEGVYRFLQRVWRLVVDERSGELNGSLVDAPGDSEAALWRTLHRTVKKVRSDTESLRMNTAIAQMMVFVNEATSSERVPIETVSTFVRVLAPYAPHLAEELWQRLGGEGLVSLAPWPEHDEALCIDEEITVVIQVNGKKRGEISVAKDISREALHDAALDTDVARKWLEGGEPRRVIVVPGKLVNIVV
jgi:leucyl-tRNA synthetase